MDEAPVTSNETSEELLKDWETPELIIENVETVTRGGTIGDLEADDAFYS
jgi:hypothetical protein